MSSGVSPETHEHVAVEPVERRRVQRTASPVPSGSLLDGDLDAVVARRASPASDDDERVGAERARGRDHPVDDPPAEQRMQVLRRRGLHPRAEPAGHDDGCEVRSRQEQRLAGAPGFEPGIAGPKPAALPLGYAPSRSAARHVDGARHALASRTARRQRTRVQRTIGEESRRERRRRDDAADGRCAKVPIRTRRPGDDAAPATPRRSTRLWRSDVGAASVPSRRRSRARPATIAEHDDRSSAMIGRRIARRGGPR